MAAADPHSQATDQIGPPLSGVRIIDASRVLAGPFCGAILADLGAEVIRMEHPEQMDEVRGWAPVVDGTAAAFAAVNHSKHGIGVDLSHPGGAEIFKRLLRTSDVLIDNYRPGTLAKFGFDWPVLHRINPRLIHCSIRAFPTGTRDENLPGYEAAIQAYSGIMSMTGERNGDPVRCGPSVVDLGTGMASAIAVLAALRQRERTGQGSYVEPALLRTATNLVNFQLAAYSLGGILPQRFGSGHPSLVPYGTFHTADGPVLLAASNDRLWLRMWRILFPGEETRYATLAERVTNRDALNGLLAGKVCMWKRDDLLAKLFSAGIPAAPVQTLPEYLADETLETAGVVERVALRNDREILLAGSLFGGDLPKRRRYRPPAVGEHTDDVLSELGVAAGELSRLREAGAIR
jgi:formyl-CoA transferase/CoA:oxalate CoA-transferase